VGVGTDEDDAMIHAVVTHQYKAIVKGVTIYVGDDLELAMATFEAFADRTAVLAGADMVVYMMPPFAVSHMVPGFENRPVVEAHAMGVAPDRRFVGCLYGVSRAQWQGRVRLP
jgi:hypothetical protein